MFFHTMLLDRLNLSCAFMKQFCLRRKARVCLAGMLVAPYSEMPSSSNSFSLDFCFSPAKVSCHYELLSPDFTITGLTHKCAHVTKAQDKTTSFQHSLDMLKEKHEYLGRVSLNDVKDALVRLRFNETIALYDGLLLLSMCGKAMPTESAETKQQLAEQIMTILSSHGGLDISHYNKLLFSYLENDLQFRPFDILMDLRTKKITLNRVTYQCLIMRYCENGDMEAATSLVNMMKQQNLKINENVYNPLIYGYTRLRECEKATEVQRIMKEAGFESDWRTAFCIARAHASVGDIERMDKAIAEAKADGWRPNLSDLFALIYILAKNKHDASIDRVLPLIESNADLLTESANFIYKLTSENCIEAAFKVLNTVQSIVPPDTANFYTIDLCFLSGLVRAKSSVATILQYCHLLSDSSNVSKSELIGRAVYCAFEQKQFETATGLLEHFEKTQKPVNTFHFLPLLYHYACVGKFTDIVGVLEWAQRLKVLIDQELLYEFVLQKGILQLDSLLSKTSGTVVIQNVELSRGDVGNTINIISASIIEAFPTDALNHLVPVSRWRLGVPTAHNVKTLCEEICKSDLGSSCTPEAQQVNFQKMQKAELEFKRIKELNLSIDVDVYLHLLSAYAVLDDLSSAMAIFEEVRSKLLSVSDVRPLFRLATQLANKGKYEDISEILNCLGAKSLVKSPANLRTLQALLYSVCESGREDILMDIISVVSRISGLNRLELVVELLAEHIKCRASLDNVLTLFLNLLKTAAEVDACFVLNNAYKMLVTAGDQCALQKVFDADVILHNSDSAALNLSMALLQTGKVSEAERLLSNSVMTFDNQLVTRHCAKLADQNDVKTLEAFLQASLRIAKCPRQILYNFLVVSLRRTNNWSAAQEVWDKMQEENVQPTASAVTMLADLFLANGQKLPFELVDVYLKVRPTVSRQQQPQPIVSSEMNILTKLAECVRKSNAQDALKALKDCDVCLVPHKLFQSCVTLLLHNDIGYPVVELVLERFRRDAIVPDVVLIRDLCTFLVRKNDLDTMLTLREHMPIENNASLCSGITDLHIKKDYSAALDVLNQAFVADLPITHFAAALSKLSVMPEHAKEVIGLLNIVVNGRQNCTLLLSNIWTELLVSGNYEVADLALELLLRVNSELRIDTIKNCCKRAVENKNDECLQRLLPLLIDPNTGKPTLSKASLVYETIVKIKASKGDRDGARLIFEEASRFGLTNYMSVDTESLQCNKPKPNVEDAKITSVNASAGLDHPLSTEPIKMTKENRESEVTSLDSAQEMPTEIDSEETRKSNSRRF